MKTFIFDFNGTIVDDLPLVYDLAVKELTKRNIQPHQNLEELRQDGVKAVMKEYEISKLEMLKIYLSMKKNIKSGQNDCPVVKCLVEVLQKLHQNSKIYVFSSNSIEVIEDYLKKHNIDKYFDGVFEDNSYFGKQIGLEKLIKKYKLDPKETFYMGDESRDMEAANKLGINSIAVTWGFEGEKALRLGAPKYIVNRPEELLELI